MPPNEQCMNDHSLTFQVAKWKHGVHTLQLHFSTRYTQKSATMTLTKKSRWWLVHTHILPYRLLLTNTVSDQLP